jgi:hypothetical protein
MPNEPFVCSQTSPISEFDGRLVVGPASTVPGFLDMLDYLLLISLANA